VLLRIRFLFHKLFWLPSSGWATFLTGFYWAQAERFQREGYDALARDRARKALRLMDSPTIRTPLAARLRLLRRHNQSFTALLLLRDYYKTGSALERLLSR
jgi:hypothetical protein